jgi:hypothetical protein
LPSHSIIEKNSYPALKKQPIGVRERAHNMQPVGGSSVFFRPEIPLKVLANLKKL